MRCVEPVGRFAGEGDRELESSSTYERERWRMSERGYSVTRKGRLFHDGAYTDEQEWVAAGEYWSMRRAMQASYDKLAEVVRKYECDPRLQPKSGYDSLRAEVERLRAALEPLASLPVEDFGKQDKPDLPLVGWNDHVIFVRDVLEARAALASHQPKRSKVGWMGSDGGMGDAGPGDPPDEKQQCWKMSERNIKPVSPVRSDT